MRVAVASWTIGQIGGIESYLSAVMPAMCHAGLEVSFFHEVDAPPQRTRVSVPPGVPVFSVASSGAERAIAALVEWSPDVVYVHGLHDVQTADRLADVAPSVTFVHTYIGTCISGTKTHMSPQPIACAREFGAACLALYFPRQCGGHNPVTMWRLYRAQSDRLVTLGRQAAVVTHSEHMKNELAAHGIAARVLAYPISMPEVSGPQSTGKSIDILFAGRMDSVKGGIFLLDALPQIRRELNQPLRVQFSGDGPARSHWETHARRIQQRDPQLWISFAGWCDEDQLSLQMQNSRLLVVPSVWPEPFGSVGLAAARYGVPAAAFAVGGIPQWLHDGVNGHLATATPPRAAALADAVVQCLRNPDHYEVLSRGARQMAARFTMDRHLPELRNVFDQVVNGRS
jgi:glycosyltransferase involved in cell wall biosynthesis